MKRLFIHPNAVNNLNLSGAQLWNKTSGAFSKSLNLGQDFNNMTNKIGNLLNGDMAGYMGKSAEEFFGTEAGMVVGSAFDILMSWQKGKDTKEAAQNLLQVNQIASAVKANADAGTNTVKGIITLDAGTAYTNLVTQSQSNANEVVTTVNDTQENSENIMTENEGLSSDIGALEDERQQIQDEILQLETEKNEIEEEKQSIEYEIEMTNNETTDLKSELDGLSEEDKNGPKGQELKAKIQNNGEKVSGLNAQLESTNQQITDIDSKIKTKEADVEGISGNIQTMSDKIVTNLEATKEENEVVIALSGEKVDEIEQASNEIVKMYGESQQAINEVKNILQGNFAKMDQQTLIKMSTEMVKASINGTEGGILAAAASAAGVGSVISFGASSGLAMKYAMAADDKVKGVGSHIFANGGMKIAENEFKNYMYTQLNQVITATLGPEFAQLTDFAREGIEQAKQDIADTGITTVSSSPGGSNSSGSSGASGSAVSDSPQKKPQTQVA